MKNHLNFSEIPTGPLIAEHRLLERYLGLMKKEAVRIDRGEKPNRILAERLIDFFKTYAHRCHYGKEEEILFRRLYEKRLSPEHKKGFDALILEHIQERELIGRLEIAQNKYWLGDSKALTEIQMNLKDLLKFYPRHMQREEQELFPAGMDYFGPGELKDMLRDFARFDQNLIHEKYIGMADRYEGVIAPSEYADLAVQRMLQPEGSIDPDNG